MNSLKIKDLELENFKNLTLKKLEINGRSFVIISKNASGKSSLIDAIMSPMDKNVLPSQPIKKGQERAMISETIFGEVDGEHREFKMDLHFTPSNGNGRLELYNEKGEKIPSPGSYLDRIIGNFSFEVESFLRGSDAKSNEKRIKVLKQVSGKEKELDELDVNKKELIKNREDIGRDIRNLDATIYQHGITDEEFQKYSAPCKNDPAAIKVNLDNLQPNIDKINGVKDKLNQKINDRSHINIAIKSIDENGIKNAERILKLQQEIKDIQEENKLLVTSKEDATKCVIKLTEDIDKGNKWILANPMPDVKEISDRLEEANTHVRVHAKIKEFEIKQKDLLKKKADYESMQGEIAVIESSKKKLISESKLPAGITFDETGIYLDGLPFESKQQNTAKKMEIGEEIVMAMNPGLKVLFVRDGSLYDKTNLKRLVTKAEARGYQVIIEIVGENDEPEIKWVEEYLNPEL